MLKRAANMQIVKDKYPYSMWLNNIYAQLANSHKKTVDFLFKLIVLLISQK